MNTGFYKDLDTNFEQAFYLCNKDFSHEELMEMLHNGNIPQKQIAALKLDNLYSKLDADVLINNLTGCDGKIREAVALKIYELIKNKNLTQYFIQSNPKIFADATIDINANVCRLVVDSISELIKDKSFASNYINFILDYTTQALDEIDKFIFRDKKYVINKQIFKLYWCLEAIKICYKFVTLDKINTILNKCIHLKEYTIREKVAQIVVLIPELESLKNTLQNDDNYYVREIILNH